MSTIARTPSTAPFLRGLLLGAVTVGALVFAAGQDDRPEVELAPPQVIERCEPSEIGG